MKVNILGCSGGMGQGEYTTSILINDALLIDAGSGLGRLTQSEMLCLKDVFITHAHLDHVCFLPLLLDNLFEQLHTPLHVFALPEVIQALNKHIFNWSIWPDFGCLPDPDHAVLKFKTVTLNQPISVGSVQVFPVCAQHVVPACGYYVKGSQGQTFCFSGDTCFDQKVIDAYKAMGPIDALMLECAFPNRLANIAHQSQHLTPATLKNFLDALDVMPKQLWITHLKPAFRDEIWLELQQLNMPIKLHLLCSGETFFL